MSVYLLLLILFHTSPNQEANMAILVNNPFKVKAGRGKISPAGKPSKFISCCLIIAFGAAGLHFINTGNQQAYHFEETSIQKQQTAGEIGLTTSPIAEYENETKTIGPSGALHMSIMEVEAEQKSRAYPVWIEKRRAIDSNTRPYGWCVPEDIATKTDESPKGLLFVKVHKCSSSTGAGVTLRIQDGLSKRLHHHPNQTQTDNNVTCFAHYDHATARKLRFQERDLKQSFLWSFVREPAQRTLR